MDVTSLHFLFDRLPGPDGARLIEVEDADGNSLCAGRWRTRADGLAELVVPAVRLSDLALTVSAADAAGSAGARHAALLRPDGPPPQDAEWDTPGCRATPE